MNNLKGFSLGLVLFTGVLSGCQFLDQETVIAGQTEIIVDDPVNPTNTVCDPLSGGQAAGADDGLYAQLYFQHPGDEPLTSAQSFATEAQPAGLHLFFSELNVPTRMFDQGFYTRSGSLLQTPQGHTLYEYFGLKFETKIVLGPNDPQGLYQFAILSDDGSVVLLDQGAGFDTHIDNDGVHPSRFKCGQSFVDMTLASAVPAQIYYYQGPRYHISLVLLWREVTPEMLASQNPYAHSTCNMEGNLTFFNPNEPTSPATALWNSTLADGWRVLTPDNFKLPAHAPSNPCNGGGGCTGIGCGGGGIGV